VRPFPDILRELSHGEAVSELTATLTEVVQAVRATGKSGSVSLTISVEKNGENSVFLSEKIASKVPQLPRSKTAFFATASGSLDRDDPDRAERRPVAVVGQPIPDTRSVG